MVYRGRQQLGCSFCQNLVSATPFTANQNPVAIRSDSQSNPSTIGHRHFSHTKKTLNCTWQ